jgi:hypothetical protein
MRISGYIVGVALTVGACAGPQGNKVHWVNEDYDITKCTNIGTAKGHGEGATGQGPARDDAANQAAKMGGTTLRVSGEGSDEKGKWVEVQVFKCEP